MNQGLTISETVEQVKLPKEFQEKDFLGEFYGTIEWTVKSIYTGYAGWFDGDAANLLPVSDREYRKTLAELIGEEKLVEKILSCIKTEQYQMALQLLSLVDQPDLKKQALLLRAKQVTSANARHYLIASAKAIVVS